VPGGADGERRDVREAPQGDVLVRLLFLGIDLAPVCFELFSVIAAVGKSDVCSARQLKGASLIKLEKL
jgi:hypothetical protein